MLDQNTRNYYIDIFLHNLEKISSQKKQEKAWFHGDYEGFDTFVEIFEGFMSPCEDVKQWTILTDQQRQDLQKYYNLLLSYDDTKNEGGRIVSKSDKEICRDPEWEKLRKLGRDLYEQLKNIPL